MKDMINDIPLVTIVCIAYNHERYIAQAIESFLQQKTDFKFEILLHDDASTDNTGKIISEYAMKYPQQIKTILQTENQYSKNSHIWENICFPKVKSKYIAICEGDDFWCSLDKLQRQIDKLESDDSISMTCCNSYIVSEEGERIKTVFPYEKEGFIKPDDIINSDRAMMSTCTIVFRRSILDFRYDFYDQTITGDYPLEVLCATNGNVFYFEEPMACYRIMVPGSWTQAVKADKFNRKQHELFITTSAFLLELNEYTKGVYSKAIYTKICRYMKSFIVLHGDAKSDQYKKIVRSLPIRYSALISVIKIFPGVIPMIKIIISKREK